MKIHILNNYIIICMEMANTKFRRVVNSKEGDKA